MKSLIRFRLAAIVMALFMTIFVPASAQTGWTVQSTVVHLVNTVNGGVNVYLSPTLTGCVSQSGYGSSYASIYPDHPGINRIKADLLVAMQTGQKVQLYLWDDCKVVESILIANQ